MFYSGKDVGVPIKGVFNDFIFEPVDRCLGRSHDVSFNQVRRLRSFSIVKIVEFFCRRMVVEIFKTSSFKLLLSLG